MFGADNSEQLYHLFLFGGLGFLLGLYYDLFRVWRLLFASSPRAVVIQDIFFSLSSTLAFFLLTLAVTGGLLRWYLFLGVLLGLAAYRATVGLVLVRAIRWLLRVLHRIGRTVGRCITAPFRWLFSLLAVPAAVMSRFLKKTGVKIRVFFKKLLKFVSSILYTKKSKSKERKGGTTEEENRGSADRPSPVPPIRRYRRS